VRAERRQRRLDAEAAARRRRRWRRLALPVVVGAGALGAVALLALAAGFGQPEIGRPVGLQGPAARHLEPGEPLPQQSQPPSSGPHYASRAAYGVSTVPIDPGNWIHVLEHGGIVVLYRCEAPDACSEVARQLDEQVYAPARNGRFGERKLTITPYQEMTVPIMAISWGRVLEQDAIDPAQLLAFYDRFLDRGPENAR